MHFCNTFDDNNCSVSSGFVGFRQVSFGFARFRGKGLPFDKGLQKFELVTDHSEDYFRNYSHWSCSVNCLATELLMQCLTTGTWVVILKSSKGQSSHCPITGVESAYGTFLWNAVSWMLKFCRLVLFPTTHWVLFSVHMDRQCLITIYMPSLLMDKCLKRYFRCHFFKLIGKSALLMSA